jgi:hypothetical protein
VLTALGAIYSNLRVPKGLTLFVVKSLIGGTFIKSLLKQIVANSGQLTILNEMSMPSSAQIIDRDKSCCLALFTCPRALSRVAKNSAELRESNTVLLPPVASARLSFSFSAAKID